MDNKGYVAEIYSRFIDYGHDTVATYALVILNTHLHTFDVSYCISRYGNIGIIKSKHNIFSNQLWILCIENYSNKDNYHLMVCRI